MSKLHTPPSVQLAQRNKNSSDVARNNSGANRSGLGLGTPGSGWRSSGGKSTTKLPDPPWDRVHEPSEMVAKAEANNSARSRKQPVPFRAGETISKAAPINKAKAKIIDQHYSQPAIQAQSSSTRQAAQLRPVASGVKRNAAVFEKDNNDDEGRRTSNKAEQTSPESSQRPPKRLKAGTITPMKSINGKGHGVDKSRSNKTDKPLTPVSRASVLPPKQSKSELVALATGPRRTGRPRAPSQMPRDILYLIFRHLSPKDLVTLTRVNTILRGVLLSPWSACISVWRGARERWGGPLPPSDFSEARWSRLLFGGAFCEVCGKPRTSQIEFHLRRRVCKTCLKANLVKECNFQKLYPRCEEKVLDLIPYIPEVHRGKATKYFWGVDIVNMDEEMHFHRAPAARGPLLRQQFEDFLKQRHALVRETMEHAAVYQKWYKNSS